MPVGVHQPRCDDHPAGVDLRRTGRRQPWPDRGDPAALDEHVAVGEVAEFRIHGQHMGVPDDDAGVRQAFPHAQMVFAGRAAW
jgi:hypothetical protein